MNIQSHSSEYKSMDDECSNSSIKAQKGEDSDTPIESTKNESKSNVDQEQSLNPMIWISMSLGIAVLLAVYNNVTSLNSKYGLKSREIMSPGSVISNIGSLIIISLKSKSDTSEYFHWFREMYYINDENRLPGKLTNKHIKWIFVLATIVLSFVSIFTQWSMVESYYLASEVDLNNGLVMCVFVLKPLINSIAFFLLFGQTLRKTDILAIGLLIGSILLIAFSNSDVENSETRENLLYVFISLGLLFISVLLSCFNILIGKYFLGHKGNQGNTAGYFNVSSMLNSTFFLIWFIIDLANSFTFTAFEFICSQFAAFILGK